MYINKEVQLPEDLLSAQREDRLVVFAGAGVSMGPPSNLPSFDSLATQVAGAAMSRADGEAFDTYLGRVEAEGVDVHARTRKIIDDPASKPNDLHRYLLTLFREADAVRLITTNFDRHFTTAGRALYGDQLNIYYAPALPLGREVHGVVYLHGAVEAKRSRLVLTDRDFGQAYLTDAWATRMLREVFERFTVLFVGYSHSDTVMRYLARGLVPGTKRYSLTLPGSDDHWRQLGITPVHYPGRPSPDAHGALVDAVEAWVEDVGRGTLDHESRIRDIVRENPPLEPDLADYISAALTDPVRVRFFTAHARDPVWLRWANEHDVFDQLFQVQERVEENAADLAHWIAEHFAVDHPAESLRLVARRGGLLHPVLWHAIARRIARDPKPAGDLLGRWVAVLVQSALSGQAEWILTPLLAECRLPEDRAAALLILRHLTKPRLSYSRVLGEPVSRDDDGVVRLEAEVVIEAEEHFLKKAWADVFKPNLDSLYVETAHLAGERLSEIHQLLDAAGAANEDWDPLSFRRSAIEPHEQDRYQEAVDVLIDAARDSCEWALGNDHAQGRCLINQWGAARAPLLRRLAIHGLAHDPQLDPDLAIDLIIAEEWIYDTPLKHEVFRLVEAAYPAANADRRRLLIEHSMQHPVLEHEAADADAARIVDYERYNFAVWLHRIAPDCPLAAAHFERLQEAHQDFRPRPYPDLSMVMGDVERYVPESPVSLEYLASKPAREALRYIASYEGESERGPTREGLLLVVTDLTKQNPAWGIDLLAAADQEGEGHRDLWRSGISGLREADLTNDQWDRLLEIISRQTETLYELAGLTSHLLEDGLKSKAIPAPLISTVESVVDSLFQIATHDEAAVARQVESSWVSVAINHPGGELAQVWLQALSRRRGEEGDSWKGLADKDRERLQRVLKSESGAAELARVILASHLAFFYSLDAEWTTEYLVPLFNWNADERQAEQAWHGFLVWGRFSEPLLEVLMRDLQDSFARIDSDLRPVRDGICRRLAAVALQAKVPPLDSGWLTRFVREASEEARVTWASEVTRLLKAVDPRAVAEAWQDWLKTYWRERLTGMPRPLTPAEAAEMVEWALALEPVLEEAVDLAIEMPTAIEENRLLLYEIKEGTLPESAPTPLARLLAHLLASTEQPLLHSCSYAQDIAMRLIESGADARILWSIAQSLARLGCRGASELKAALDSGS